MQADTVHPHGYIQLLIAFGITALVLVLRARRLTRVRPLNVNLLWIIPALYLVVLILLFVRAAPSLLGWLLCGLGLAAGAALGWQRGKTMRIAIDPETGALNQKGSIASFLFIVVLVAVRQIGQIEGSALHLDVTLLSQVLGALGFGMFTAMRIEMYLRGRRLLAAARA